MPAFGNRRILTFFVKSAGNMICKLLITKKHDSWPGSCYNYRIVGLSRFPDRTIMRRSARYGRRVPLPQWIGRVRLLALVFGLGLATSASAGLIGPAGGYNAFVTGNFFSNQNDIQGSLAVGGNATLSSYYIGGNLLNGGNLSLSGGTIAGTADVFGNADINNAYVGSGLTANGYASLTSGTVNGNLAAGTDATLQNSYVAGNVQAGRNLDVNQSTVGGGAVFGNSANVTQSSVLGGVAQGQNSVPAPALDFSAAAHFYSSYAAFLAGLPGNGSVAVTGGALALTGVDPLLNVFHLSTGQLNAAAGTAGLAISVPTGATALIDVSGASGVLTNFAMTFGSGASAQDLLFNFDQATSLAVNAFGLEGSLLAPLANVDVSNGQIAGNLVAASFSGGQLNLQPFQGTLPVPEPPAAGLMLAGIAGLGWLGGKKRTLA